MKKITYRKIQEKILILYSLYVEKISVIFNCLLQINKWSYIIYLVKDDNGLGFESFFIRTNPNSKGFEFLKWVWGGFGFKLLNPLGFEFYI